MTKKTRNIHDLSPKDVQRLECVTRTEYRATLVEMIDKITPDGIGVEIGVLRAENSRYFLSHSSAKHLYMVDPWRAYPKMEHYYTSIVKTMGEKYPDKATVLRGSIEEVVDQLPEQLDFCFIDGNHSYPDVMRDLEYMMPRIRPQGLLAGHDLRRCDGVEKAVLEFFGSRREQIEGARSSYEGFKNGHFSKKDELINRSTKGDIWWTVKK